MAEKPTMLIRLNVVIEVPSDKPREYMDEVFALVNTLNEAVEGVLGPMPDHLGRVSSEWHRIDTSHFNAGRCAVCGIWVTDRDKPNQISAFSSGATVDGALLCIDHFPPHMVCYY
jgi:hypothetical protein